MLEADPQRMRDPPIYSRPKNRAASKRMNCFRHSDQPSVGICSHCGKGVCADCSIQEGLRLVCSDSCASEVAELKRLLDRSSGAKPSLTGQLFMPLFLLAIGGILALYGWERGGLFNFLGVMGFALVASGLVAFLTCVDWSTEAEER